MINRVEEIKKKGFNMVMDDTPDIYANSYNTVDFSKIKVGLKTLDDAIVDLGDYKKIDKRYGDKTTVLTAINNGDFDTMRDISNFFFKTSGIYNRLCRYMAYLYRYDWLITPYVYSDSIKTEKVQEGFYKALTYLDNFEVKKFFGEVALKVIRFGCYYGYLIPMGDRMTVQELPQNYCRSRFSVNGRPAVEFNMKYFDDAFKDASQRMRMLNLFPDDFKKGYIKYKEGKLVPEFPGDTRGWYLLDPKSTIKFNINGEDFPFFISTIPAIIDLNEAQALDKKKMEQQLVKIIIQKMPLDKNGELIFDVDEAQALHNNAVRMLQRAIGIDVLTTFAEVEVADMNNSSSTTAADDSMARSKSNVYDQGGVSQLQFNTDGNIALEKSILNDEASVYNLILQFEGFLNDLLAPFNKNPKKLCYKAQILTTTIYNYKELAKLYKEQTQLGYSKMLPQIALGQSQSSILANAYFENDILELWNVFIPPLMSSTMNGDFLTNRDGSKAEAAGAKDATGEEKTAGRKELEDDKKSEKTIQNKESQS